MTESIRCILLVEDDIILAMNEKMQLEKYGYVVRTVTTGEDAVEAVRNSSDIDLILMDINLGDGIDGTQAAEIILKSRDVPVVFLSSHTNPEVVEKTEKITSYGYVVKNSSITVLDASIKMALRLFETNTELADALVERKEAETKLVESEAAIRNKLKAITEPESDLGELDLADIIDVPAVQSLMENFYHITGCGGAIVDSKGKVLVGVDWQDICAKFHRCHPEAQKNCIESDTTLASGIARGSFKSYHCKNGMWDMATPIVVSGRHMGNIYFGQFFYADEEIDEERFRNQARLFEFDEAEYLAALERVPRYDQERVENIITFYSKLGEMISALSFSNVSLSRTLAERKRAEDELKRFKTISDNAVYGKAIADLHGNLVYINRFFANIHGYEPEDLIGKPLSLFHNEQQMEAVGRLSASLIREGSFDPTTVWHCHKDGTDFPMLMSGILLKDDNGNPRYMASSAVDITEHKRAEEALHQERNLLLTIIDSIPDLIYVKNTEARKQIVNRADYLKCGFRSKEDLIGKDDFEIFPHEIAQPFFEDDQKVLKHGESVVNREERLIMPNGKIAWQLTTKLPMYDPEGNITGLVGIGHDITDRRLAEEEIQKQLAEKEILLREVHHRVKNNTATIERFLSLQAGSTTHAEVKTALQEAISRVQSTRVLYDKLLLSKDLDQISIKDYAESLVESLVTVFDPEKNITVETRIADIEVASKKAVSIGIIINELLTNVFKYAFKDRDNGLASVSINKEESTVTLIIKDDGIGIDERIIENKSPGFGLTIVKMLVEQLGGTYSLSNDNGAKSVVRFEV